MFIIYYFYVTFIAIIVIYILNCKKRDLYIISILCSIIYFLPCFFGYVTIKYFGDVIYDKIDIKLYIIHIMFIIIMMIFHVMKDNSLDNPNRRLELFFDDKFIMKALNFMWLIMFLILIIVLGEDIFAYKTMISGQFLNYYRVVYNLLLVFTVIVNYRFKKYANILIQIPGLILTVIQGHRSYIVFILVGIIINEFINKEVNIFKIRYIAFITFTAFFGFLGKIFIKNIRLGINFIDNIIILLDKNIFIESVTNSEPFITQYILNKVIISDLRLGIEYILRILLKIMFVPSKIFSNIDSFYDIFINRFYPNINYGIAYNIFSEPYAIGGMLGVIIFIIIYGFVLGKIEKLVRSGKKSVSSLGLCLSSIYIFYIFRNSIENIILWTQILFILFVLSYFFQLIKYKFKIYYRFTRL